MEVPEGYVFMDGNGLRALLKRNGEPTSGNANRKPIASIGHRPVGPSTGNGSALRV